MPANVCAYRWLHGVSQQHRRANVGAVDVRQPCVPELHLCLRLLCQHCVSSVCRKRDHWQDNMAAMCMLSQANVRRLLASRGRCGAVLRALLHERMNKGIILLIGPMFSGKSSELKRLLRQRRLAKKRVIAIKNEIDSREHDQPGLLSSRDGSTPIAALCVKRLCDFDLSGVYGAVVGIDEGQFFEADDLHQFCERAVAQNNLVIVSALSGTVHRLAEH